MMRSLDPNAIPTLTARSCAVATRTPSLLTRWQRGLPRFDLHPPGQTPALEQQQRRFPAWCLGTVVVPVLVGLAGTAIWEALR